MASAQPTKTSSKKARSAKSTPSKAANKPEAIDLKDPKYYHSRELSWLAFNERVLHEALDDRTPLLERLKFLGIFCSNLDEYFMVRVAGIKQQILANVNRRTADGRTPQDHLGAISQKLRPVFTQQHRFFETTLRPQLKAKGVYLLDYADLTVKQVSYLETYFDEQIFPVLTPLAVDSGHPFPYISNLSLNLAVVVRETESGDAHFARVKVPKVLPRFVVLPLDFCPVPKSGECLWVAVPMEQVIAKNLSSLFPGMVVDDCYTFRITRNADLAVEEDEADDLMLAIEQELRKRRLGGSAVRMEIQASTSPAVRSTLMQEMGLTEADVYDVEGLIGLGDLMSLMSLPLPELKDPKWSAVVPKHWHFAFPGEGDSEAIRDVFDLIRERDRLVHHPYDSFSATVQQLITQAAHDPDVLAIKMTLYRTSGDSPIVNALISAAENGKQVVVLVELKARFDEENNINWARTLESSGVHVVYGLMGLKTHTKVTLIVRRERGQIRRYVHIGTGNYNPKTARLYTDLGLMSCREDLGADLTELFNYLTGYSRQQTFRKLLIAPVSLRDRMTALIEQEIDHARSDRPARIIAKMNSLVDQAMIQLLYQASQAGVQVDLIVRGICCLVPGLPDVSANIRVISVIGRFLEHSRIFYFHNNEDPLIFIGSADWMPRNLDRRVEAVTPVEDLKIRRALLDILNVSLEDNRQAWDMQPDGTYIQRQPQPDEAERSTHETFMRQAKEHARSS
ncbi:MAG: polyphosphate kinase 1 [Cyanobacteria bacterium P01_A01_bin.114]